MLRLKRALVACLLVGAVASCAWAQAKLLSIPIDPDNATLEMGRRRPDGTQMVLLVRISGSPPIKFVATREDMLVRQAEQLEELIRLNDAETARGEVLRNIVQQNQTKVGQLETGRTRLLDEVLQAQAVAVRARKRVKPPDAGAGAAGSGGEGSADGSAAAPGGKTTATTAASPTAVKPAVPPAPAPAGTPKADAEAALDHLPPVPDLLPVAIPDNATLKMIAIRPDGTQFELELTAGGIHLRYVASREDVVATQVEQYLVQAALRKAVEARNVALETENMRLDAKADQLEAEIADLRKGALLAKQNSLQLAEILKAQRPQWWQVLLTALPTIAGIAALAAR